MNIFAHFFHTFFGDAISGLTTGAFLLAIIALIYQWYQPRKTKRSLEKQFGREAFSLDQIKSATRYYVRPYCSSIDPTNEGEVKRIFPAREDLFSAITRFLQHQNPHRHLLILADSGMGKSSFVINYYAYNQKLWFKRQRIAIVPLGTKHVAEDIGRIKDQNEVSIFLDALDEDVAAIKDHRNRLNELMELCSRFRRVIITCRTQFFPSDEEIPKDAGIIRLGPRALGESHKQEFWKLYLLPFESKDIDRYIRKRYSVLSFRRRNKARSIMKSIPMLAPRPMIMAYVPDLLLDESLPPSPSQCTLYSIMIRKWADRESSWIDTDLLIRFSEKLAIDIYKNRVARGGELLSRKELAAFCDKHSFNIPQWNLTGRSLLNRDAEGNLKFSHRSFMEFLYVRSLLGGNYDCIDELTDNMQQFIQQELKDLNKILKVDLRLIRKTLEKNKKFLLHGKTRIRHYSDNVMPQEINIIFSKRAILAYSLPFEHPSRLSIHLNKNNFLGLEWRESDPGLEKFLRENTDYFATMERVNFRGLKHVAMAYIDDP